VLDEFLSETAALHGRWTISSSYEKLNKSQSALLRVKNKFLCS
jgi:hypothetical protein